MPRNRSPLIVDGEPFAEPVPGLIILPRGGSRLQSYWRASKQAAKLGYRPKNIELHYDLLFIALPCRAIAVHGDRAEFDRLVSACRKYDAGMRSWLREPDRKPKIVFNGLIESLIEIYLRHPHSPFRELPDKTQEIYEYWLNALRAVAGNHRIDQIIGPDLRSWFAEVRKPAEEDGPPRNRLAYGAVRQMPRIIVNFGMELGLAPCFRLSQILTVTKLKLPRDPKTGRRPKKVRVAMSFTQAEAIVKAGLARGTKQHRSVALGVAAQFEFALNQIDVIGWWEQIDRTHAVTKGEHVEGGYVWRPGLTYGDLASGVLQVERSKTSVPGIYDLAEAPLFQRALAAVPEAERSGALVVDSRGVPMQRRYYIDLYRELADAAGVPAAVKNMHARHGAASEADDAGVDEQDIARLTQHSNAATTRAHYLKGSLVKSRMIARARVASRTQEEG